MGNLEIQGGRDSGADRPLRVLDAEGLLRNSPSTSARNISWQIRNLCEL